MTPEERNLVIELFDRLATLEDAPRDPDAERLIRDGLRQAPNAPYALVQTVLVQDEALKRANARIQELEGGDATAGQGGSFLDSMRGALFGRDPGGRGSVPSVRTGATGDPYPPAGPYATPYPPAYGAPSPGGSFLGNAAATAAGVIGGSLLLDGIRSAFGHGHSYAGAYEPAAPTHSPWNNSAADSDLARQADLQSLGFVGRDQFFELTGGIGFDAGSFRFDHAVVHLPLGPLLGVAARGGGESAGQDNCRTCEHERPGRGAGGREPLGDAGRRHDSVVEIHDRLARTLAPALSIVDQKDALHPPHCRARAR